MNRFATCNLWVIFSYDWRRFRAAARRRGRREYSRWRSRTRRPSASRLCESARRQGALPRIRAASLKQSHARSTGPTLHGKTPRSPMGPTLHGKTPHGPTGPTLHGKTPHGPQGPNNTWQNTTQSHGPNTTWQNTTRATRSQQYMAKHHAVPRAQHYMAKHHTGLMVPTLHGKTPRSLTSPRWKITTQVTWSQYDKTPYRSHGPKMTKHHTGPTSPTLQSESSRALICCIQLTFAIHYLRCFFDVQNVFLL